MQQSINGAVAPQLPKQEIGTPYRKVALRRAGRVQSAQPEQAGRREAHPFKIRK